MLTVHGATYIGEISGNWPVRARGAKSAILHRTRLGWSGARSVCDQDTIALDEECGVDRDHATCATRVVIWNTRGPSGHLMCAEHERWMVRDC